MLAFTGQFVLFAGSGTAEVPFDTVMVGGSATTSAAALQRDNDALRTALERQVGTGGTADTDGGQ